MLRLASPSGFRRHHTAAYLAGGAVIALGWTALGASGGPLVPVLGSLVLILGLPHGALDLWIARRAGLWGRGGGFWAFHLGYLALAGLVVLGFVAAPVLALGGFLALSVWHFADDWPGLPRPVRIACAAGIVLVPTLFHPEEVGAIFRAVTGTDAAVPGRMPYTGGLVAAWLLAGGLALAVASDRRAAVEIAVTAALAAALPPLVFFATYFTLLHGPRHLMKHGGLIAGPQAKLVLGAYTALAFVLIAGLGLALRRIEPGGLDEGVLRAVFVGLAALTVPHALLLDRHARPTGARRERV